MISPFCLTFQIIFHVSIQQAEWLRFDHAEMTVMEALEEVSAFIDESDPDVRYILIISNLFSSVFL